MITVVNGFFCENGCDAAKAKRGEDPHPKIDPQTGEPEKKGALQKSRDTEAAVSFGGALSDLNAVQRVTGATSADTDQTARAVQTQAVDLLV